MSGVITICCVCVAGVGCILSDAKTCVSNKQLDYALNVAPARAPARARARRAWCLRELS